MLELDAIGWSIVLGALICSVFVTIGFVRHGKSEAQTAFYVFSAVLGVALGIDLISVGAQGNVQKLETTVWREYLGAAGIIVIVIAANVIVQAFKKLFEPPKKNDKNSN